MLLARISPPQARKSAAILGAILCVLGVAWELWLAPLRPGSLLWLKVLPLLVCLPWLWRGSIVMHQWWSMVVLLYFTEGVVRGWSDRGQLSAWLGWGEALIVVVYFICAIMYVRPYKKAAKKMARELLAKVKENTVP